MDINRFFYNLPLKNWWSNGDNESGFRTIFQSIYELFPKRLGILVTINRICYKKPKSNNLLFGQLTTPPFFIFIIDDENQNIWETTKIVNYKMHRNKIKILVI